MKSKSFFCLAFSMFFFSLPIIASVGKMPSEVFQYGDYCGPVKPGKSVSFEPLAPEKSLDTAMPSKIPERSPVEVYTGRCLVFEKPFDDSRLAVLIAATKALDKFYKRD